MLLLESARPFQWRASYLRFGDFRRIMWGWFAVSYFAGGINELVEGCARAGVTLHKAGDEAFK